MKRFFATVAALSLPLVMVAQENLIGAMFDFRLDKSVEKYVTAYSYTVSSKKNGQPISSLFSVKFDMPMKKADKFDPVKKAFLQDTACAYKVVIAEAGSGKHDAVTVFYGDDGKEDKARTYCNDQSRNYMLMCVRNKIDTLKRDLYALVWYKDSARNRFCGTIDKFIGPDPAKQKNKWFTLVNGLDLSDYGKFERNATPKDLFEVQKILSSLPSNTKSVRVFGKDNIVVDGKKLNIVSIEGTGDILVNGKRIHLEDYDGGLSAEASPVKSSSDFMQIFGNLRAAYLESMRRGGVAEVALNTGLVNKMLDLCKNYSPMLTKDEKSICMEAIDGMQKESVDEYLVNLLGLAKNYLKK